MNENWEKFLSDRWLGIIIDCGVLFIIIELALESGGIELPGYIPVVVLSVILALLVLRIIHILRSVGSGRDDDEPGNDHGICHRAPLTAFRSISFLFLVGLIVVIIAKETTASLVLYVMGAWSVIMLILAVSGIGKRKRTL